jgi:2-hydroxychromene-2-carboxylate isomerase
MANELKPVLYFSFRSPYSWLAVERLRKTMPDMHERIHFIPAWNPDPEFVAQLSRCNRGFRYVEMSAAKHRYIVADVRRLARRDGLKLIWPVDRAPWWELPNLVWLAARRAGADRQLYAGIVTARWERGEDICDPQVLRQLATEAGLNADTVATAPRDPDIQADGLQCLISAWDNDIFGYPYFRLGRHRFWGIDRLADFLDVLDHPATDTWPASLSQIPSFDEDTAGGCG